MKPAEALFTKYIVPKHLLLEEAELKMHVSVKHIYTVTGTHSFSNSTLQTHKPATQYERSRMPFYILL